MRQRPMRVRIVFMVDAEAIIALQKGAVPVQAVSLVGIPSNDIPIFILLTCHTPHDILAVVGYQ
jgi:hypothetical protein